MLLGTLLTWDSQTQREAGVDIAISTNGNAHIRNSVASAGKRSSNKTYHTARSDAASIDDLIPSTWARVAGL
jgi:hypothetical protein